jgi:hypothetical protein
MRSAHIRVKTPMTRQAPRPYQPDTLECAILLLLLVQQKERTRARLAEITLKRLWNRRRLGDEFVREVQEWLFRAGWALFYAGTTFGVIKTKSVEGWPRVTSKDLRPELVKVARGGFDFGRHYHLLLDDETEE